MAKKKVNNRLAYGLCKKYGIMLPQGAPPRVAWEMLKKQTGITLLEAYTNQKHQDELYKPSWLYDCENSESDWDYPDSKKEIGSAIFDNISLYKRQLERKGYIKFYLSYNNSVYTVKLYGVDNDYDFIVSNRREIL